MTNILFRNLSLLDPRWDAARGGYEVLVEGDKVKEVSDKPIKASGARVVDCGGRTLMPGLSRARLSGGACAHAVGGDAADADDR